MESFLYEPFKANNLETKKKVDPVVLTKANNLETKVKWAQLFLRATTDIVNMS